MLTVNGQAQVIVQSPEAYQQLLDDSELAHSLRVIGKSLGDAKAGKVKPCAGISGKPGCQARNHTSQMKNTVVITDAAVRDRPAVQLHLFCQTGAAKRRLSTRRPEEQVGVFLPMESRIDVRLRDCQQLTEAAR